MRQAKDLTGMVFGRWKVLEKAGLVSSGRNYKWRCLCECGTTKDVVSSLLTRGESKSCGCLRREISSIRERKHGHAVGKTSQTYNSWSGIIQRCTNPKYWQWDNYGGRGIAVCERWLSFENFLVDMGERPPGTSIDRINNSGNYEPGNCRWATPTQQTANRRERKDSLRLRHGVEVQEVRS